MNHHSFHVTRWLCVCTHSESGRVCVCDIAGMGFNYTRHGGRAIMCWSMSLDGGFYQVESVYMASISDEPAQQT